MLLDDRLLQAESIVALFTKVLAFSTAAPRNVVVTLFQEEGNSLSNLVDMQCMWFEQYYGDSVFRLGSYNLALNRFRIIEKVIILNFSVLYFGLTRYPALLRY
jgi:hypothetical protein